MKKEEILSNVSFAIAVITILICLVFRNNLVMLGIVAGIGSFLYGICITINKNTTGYLFFGIGGSLAISLLLYKFKILDKGDTFTFMICCSIFLLMLMVLVVGSIRKKKIFKIYTMSVDAEVIDLVKNTNTKKEYYKPVYSYNLDGKEYVVEALGYIDKFIPKIGDKIKLYVDPKDYMNVYFDKTMFDKITGIGLSIFLLIVSFGIIVSLFI